MVQPKVSKSVCKHILLSEENPMIKVLVADDHPIVREGLKQIISTVPDIKLGGEALNGQEVLDAVSRENWDVIVLDLNMPGKDGFEVLKDLHRDYPTLPILILSIHSEDQLAVRLIKAGAAGYMTKESAPQEFINAIRKLHSGRKYISASLAEKLADALTVDLQAEPHSVLSDREYQIFCFLAAGKSVHEIEKDLSISVKTVRTYRDRILEKMNMENDVELSRYAVEHKLI
jgi:DNA-binding NarL/FixJ family response regulator